MDKELLNRYDNIANKVEEISGKTWEGLVLQLKIESITTVIFCLLMITICAVIITLFLRQYRLGHNSDNYLIDEYKIEFKKKPIIFDNPELRDFDLNGIGLVWALITFIAGIVVVVCITQLFVSVPRFLYPEPYVIKDLIDSIGGK